MTIGVIRLGIAALLFGALAIGGVSAAPGFAEEEAPGGLGVDQEALFRAVGAMYDLDPALLRAIATVESGGRSATVSPAGAAGLMQLMPAVARRFGVGNVFDPVDSVLGAARFLTYLRERQATLAGFELPAKLPALIAAYNAGEGAVERYHGVPPYPETAEYVRRVLWRYLLDEPPPLPRGATTAGRAASRPPPEDGDTALLNQLARLRRERVRAARAALADSGPASAE